MAESKNGHNLVNISRNSLKSSSSNLNIDPKPYVKYQNPSLSRSQDIMLSRFFYFGIEKGHNFAILGRADQNKNMRSLIFFTHATYKISSS